jgi:hypothetical protein
MLTLAEAKLQLNIAVSNVTHDVELQAYVDAAIRAVEKHTDTLGAVRTVTGERHNTCVTVRLRLHHRPVQSLTSLARVDASLTWDVADLDVDVEAGVLRVVSGPLFSGLLAATYEAGHDPVPPNHNLAARIIVQHLWQTQRGAMGGRDIRGLDDSFDNVVVATGRGYAIPNAALELLGEPIPVVA